MYDQTVRNYCGGQMAELLQRSNIIDEKYIIDRIGYVGLKIRNNQPKGNTVLENIRKAFSSVKMFRKALKHLSRKTFLKLKSQESKIGAFRLGGEVHMWMYDRYSLARLLKNCGFEEISIKNPFLSDIPNWNEYELDVKNGLVYDPTSLFIEAKKKL